MCLVREEYTDGELIYLINVNGQSRIILDEVCTPATSHCSRLKQIHASLYNLNKTLELPVFKYFQCLGAHLFDNHAVAGQSVQWYQDHVKTQKVNKRSTFLLLLLCYRTYSSWKSHVTTCAKHRGRRLCWMFVFTLQIYTIIFSTKFEPFELACEQKMVWILFYWLQMFCFHKSKQYGHIPLTCTVGVHEMNPASWHTFTVGFLLL